MKKVFSLILVSVLLSGMLMAQKQLYFGLAGTGLSSVITNQNNYGRSFEMDYVVKFGFTGNATVGFDFNKSIGLKLEIGLGSLGQKYDDNFKDTAYTRDVKLKYLQIPVMFKYRTPGKNARFYIAAGPQINYLMSAHQDYLRAGIPDITTFETVSGKTAIVGEETITDRYSSLDIMGRLDLGIEVSVIKNLYINLGLTMAYGLLDINETDFRLNDKSGNYNASHNIYGGINLGINYVLPFGSK